jgi:cell division septation protein DedD
MDEVPVVSRTQRRSERRQLLVTGLLVVTIAVASFFLGVMVGERNGSARQAEIAYQASAQIAPPPLPAATAAPSRLTFYDDLPKGNAAPLGSGINLPPSSMPGSTARVQAPAPVAPVKDPAVEAAPVPAPAAKVPDSLPAAKPPPPTVAPPAPKASAGGSLVVQVAATRDQAEARRMVDRLKGKGYAASAERADLGAKGIWYRVSVGPYADRATADKAAAQLKQMKFSPMVRNR